MRMGPLSLPKKMVGRIQANKHIDFAELPPTKNKGCPMSQAMEGQVIIQSTDLLAVQAGNPQLRNLEPVLCTLCDSAGTLPAS